MVDESWLENTSIKRALIELVNESTHVSVVLRSNVDWRAWVLTDFLWCGLWFADLMRAWKRLFLTSVFSVLGISMQCHSSLCSRWKLHGPLGIRGKLWSALPPFHVFTSGNIWHRINTTLRFRWFTVTDGWKRSLSSFRNLFSNWSLEDFPRWFGMSVYTRLCLQKSSALPFF